MVVLWIVIVMLCLLTSTSSALIALHLQYRTLDTSRQEREAWQQAQEGRQRTWEVRQGKHILETEKKLADQFKEARGEWREWSIQIEQSQQDWQDRATIEKELARLPHVDHLELSRSGQRQQPERWQPSAFYGADLRGRDLSHRYLERADLRDTQLAEANLYMADLSGASLTGADLSNANLIGANLSGVDLRGANLSGVNLLVADLHNAVLHRATLSGARNLSLQQLQTAIYDGTTLIDSAILNAQLPDVIAPANQEDTGLVALSAMDETTASTPAPGETLPGEASAPPSIGSVVQEKHAVVPARKRARKARQLAAEMPAQMPPARLEEQSGESREFDRQEEESDELSSHKIIQLQAHVTKAAFSPDSKRQHNTKKRGGKSRTSRTGTLGNKSVASQNQEAQAN